MLERRLVRLVRCLTNERVDVLDEGADRSFAPIGAFATFEVSRDGCGNNLYQRAVARKEDRRWSPALSQGRIMHDVESGQSLARARDACYEAGHFQSFTLRLLNDFNELVGGECEVDCASV